MKYQIRTGLIASMSSDKIREIDIIYKKQSFRTINIWNISNIEIQISLLSANTDKKYFDRISSSRVNNIFLNFFWRLIDWPTDKAILRVDAYSSSNYLNFLLETQNSRSVHKYLGVL